ncbi:MAG: type II secretion system F family protein [Planctomycetes bacterium]|nr:type II secretion system F family protein [Planctomycetota bacterium]
MPSFKYKARDFAGTTSTGSISAKSRNDAITELKKKNLTVVDMTSAAAGGNEIKKGLFGRAARPGVKGEELVIFTRQLSTMVGAGIPILEALEIQKDQAESPGFRVVLTGVVDSVRGGIDLSKALEKYPRAFPELYVNMVRAGEVSGQLDQILIRLAEYQEASAQLVREVKSAMTYPVISLCLVFGIAAFLMIGIVPQFKPVFDSLDIKLPALTLFVMDCAFFCKNYWYIIFGLIGGAIFGLITFKRTTKGAYICDATLLRMPIFGSLFSKVALSRFSRTFSTLIKSGVPILSAMEIVAQTAGNRVIAKAVLNARESVRQGQTLSGPLSEAKVFPPMVVKMISIGERTGALDALLEKIAHFYDQQVEAAVKGLTSMIEPLLIGVMGFVVGGIVLAVFLPIFKLQEQLATSH